ncbi:hypothetical protein Goe27_01820 [Bacillus phage vB_BsuM-Goe27]|nr:hypothetical protein Goe27_01820 [Bacillus phage vB_BsuM-Goe27]
MGNDFSFNLRINRRSIVDDAANISRSIQDAQEEAGSRGMDYRCHQGFGSGFSINPRRLSAFLSGASGIQKLADFKRTLLKVATLAPVAVLSTTVVSSMTSTAYAKATDIKAPIDLLMLGRNKDSNVLTAIPEAIDMFNRAVAKTNEFLSDMPHHLAEMSVHLMSWLYELCASLILKTPLWLFSNEWFENTTYLFSLLALGVVSVLTVVESVKLMLSRGKKKRSGPMDFKTIMKRWGIVAGVITATPFLFQKVFQGLNKISDALISMGATTMNNIALPMHISGWDVFSLLIFDVILISTIVPVLWKNGRRFFDVMVLGVTSPLALTAWIFDPYRHLFQQWWSRLKHLSLVQVYYALFLLILGWFIFGVPTPTDVLGLIVKMLVVIGGFTRMTSPPRIIMKHLDNGGGFDEVYKGDGRNDTVQKVKRNFQDSATILMKPSSAIYVGYKRVKDKLKK